MKEIEVIIGSVIPNDADLSMDEVISSWNEVEAFFKGNKVVIDGVQHDITLDVSSIIERLESFKPKNWSGYLKSYFGQKLDSNTSEKNVNGNPMESKLKILSSCENLNVSRFIHQLHLAMNLAKAGSCNLYLYHIKNNNPYISQEQPEFLYSMPFEYIYSVRSVNDWPAFGRVEFSKSWEWLNLHDIQHVKLAKSPVQKACALLHRLSMSDGNYAEELLVITQALESLLLKKGEPKAYSLDKKLEAILGRPKKAADWVKRLYKLRSAITHGEHFILWDDGSDIDESSEENKYINEIHELYMIGSVAVFALLQDLLSTNDQTFEFSTIITVTKS